MTLKLGDSVRIVHGRRAGLCGTIVGAPATKPSYWVVQLFNKEIIEKFGGDLELKPSRPRGGKKRAKRFGKS